MKQECNQGGGIYSVLPNCICCAIDLDRLFASAAPKSGIQQKPVQILIALSTLENTE
jgi:hypothetical protein